MTTFLEVLVAHAFRDQNRWKLSGQGFYRQFRSWTNTWEEFWGCWDPREAIESPASCGWESTFVSWFPENEDFLPVNRCQWSARLLANFLVKVSIIGSDHIHLWAIDVLSLILWFVGGGFHRWWQVIEIAYIGNVLEVFGRHQRARKKSPASRNHRFCTVSLHQSIKYIHVSDIFEYATEILLVWRVLSPVAKISAYRENFSR